MLISIYFWVRIKLTFYYKLIYLVWSELSYLPVKSKQGKLNFSIGLIFCLAVLLFIIHIIAVVIICKKFETLNKE